MYAVSTEAVLHWLNPRYDLTPHLGTGYSNATVTERLKDLGMLTLRSGKSIVRGGLVGAVLGAATGTLCSIVAGDDLRHELVQGVAGGAILGVTLDVAQYQARYSCKRIYGSWVEFKHNMQI
ncbi:hypothetical protein HZB02_05450 [Candidatus Woesearchaeota archaeon]|nr:hypothetical protein [Candidatus Woesearchaeota archaeon]